MFSLLLRLILVYNRQHFNNSVWQSCSFLITKDKPRFSPSQFHSSQPVKLFGHEVLFPPNFAAITDKGNVKGYKLFYEGQTPKHTEHKL